MKYEYEVCKSYGLYYWNGVSSPVLVSIHEREKTAIELGMKIATLTETEWNGENCGWYVEGVFTSA